MADREASRAARLSRSSSSIRQRGSTTVNPVVLDTLGKTDVDLEFPESFEYLAQDDTVIADKREVYSWILYDWANSGYQGNVLSAFGGPFITGLAIVAASQTPDNRLYLFGPGTSWSVLPTSYFQVLTIVNVVVQIILYMTLGPIADFGSLKKKGLMLTSTICCIFTVLLIIGDPDLLGDQVAFSVAGLFYVASGWAFGLSVIYYYAYLAPLARTHYFMQETYDTGASMADMKLLKANTAHSMASWGVFWGFLSQVAILVVSIGILFAIPAPVPPTNTIYYQGVLVNTTACNMTLMMAEITAPPVMAAMVNCTELLIPPAPGVTLQYRVVNSLAGLWFFIFAIPAFMFLKKRRGPKLDPCPGVMLVGFKSVWETLKKIRKLKHTFFFLIAYFIYSDGISTVANAAPILFSVEVGMDGTLIGAAIAASYVTGAGSTLLWLFISKKTGLSAKWILSINILGLAIVPLWAFVAMTEVWEAFVAAALYGIFNGPVAAFSRSAFSRMTPHRLEAEFFSFYEITDKGTSWLGPLVITAVNEATGSFRTATFAVLAFFILGFLCLLPINFNEGNRAALAFWDEHGHEFPGGAEDKLHEQDPEIPRMRTGTMENELDGLPPKMSPSTTTHKGSNYEKMVDMYGNSFEEEVIQL